MIACVADIRFGKNNVGKRAPNPSQPQKYAQHPQHGGDSLFHLLGVSQVVSIGMAVCRFTGRLSCSYSMA